MSHPMGRPRAPAVVRRSGRVCARAASCGEARRRQPALSSSRPALRLARWATIGKPCSVRSPPCSPHDSCNVNAPLQTAGRNTAARLTGALLIYVLRRGRALDSLNRLGSNPDRIFLFGGMLYIRTQTDRARPHYRERTKQALDARTGHRLTL